MDDASALAARLAAAAQRTALQRTTTSRRQDNAATTDAATITTGAAVPLEDMAALWTVYGRRLWPLGDDITDDRILVEGRDRRSRAALNHYLREGTRPQELRRPCDRPRVSTARVSFHPTGDDDTLRITYHSLPTSSLTPAEAPFSGPAPSPGPTPSPGPVPSSGPTSPEDCAASVPPARILDVLVADR